MKKCWSMSQLRPGTGEPLAISFKTMIQLYLFYLFFCFLLTVSKRVSKAIFFDIKSKSVGLWGSYGLKQENPLQNLNISNQIVFFFSWFIVILNVSKRLSEVGYFEIKWIWWPIRQIQPETGEYLMFFQSTNPIIFVKFVSLFFELLYQRGYQK